MLRFLVHDQVTRASPQTMARTGILREMGRAELSRLARLYFRYYHLTA